METEECEPLNQNLDICSENNIRNNLKKSKPYFDINSGETSKKEIKNCFWTNWTDWSECNGNCSKVFDFLYSIYFRPNIRVIENVSIMKNKIAKNAMMARILKLKHVSLM